MGHLNEIGTSPVENTEVRNGYYITNDVTVGRRSFCLYTFGIFREDKVSLIQSKCVYFYVAIPGRGLCHRSGGCCDNCSERNL